MKKVPHHIVRTGEGQRPGGRCCVTAPSKRRRLSLLRAPTGRNQCGAIIGARRHHASGATRCGRGGNAMNE
eukprot:4614316-Pyramimonas_sp.AAC.1